MNFVNKTAFKNARATFFLSRAGRAAFSNGVQGGFTRAAKGSRSRARPLFYE